MKINSIFLILIFLGRSLLTSEEIKQEDKGFLGYVSVGVEDFRGVSNGSYPSHFGPYLQADLDYVKNFSQGDLSVQLGGSYGVYSSCSKKSFSSKSITQQGFLTAATAFKTHGEYGGAFYLAYDAMFNHNIGVFGVNPFLQQIRAKASAVIKTDDQLGVFAAFSCNKTLKYQASYPVSFRSINQINLIWDHAFENDATTSIWMGTTFRRSLMEPKKLPSHFLSGMSLLAPLIKQKCFLEARGLYMVGRKFTGLSRNYTSTFDLAFAVRYYFGKTQNNKGMLAPVANNSLMLIDSSSSM